MITNEIQVSRLITPISPIIFLDRDDKNSMTKIKNLNSLILILLEKVIILLKDNAKTEEVWAKSYIKDPYC